MYFIHIVKYICMKLLILSFHQMFLMCIVSVIISPFPFVTLVICVHYFLFFFSFDQPHEGFINFINFFKLIFGFAHPFYSMFIFYFFLFLLLFYCFLPYISLNLIFSSVFKLLEQVISSLIFSLSSFIIYASEAINFPVYMASIYLIKSWYIFLIISQFKLFSEFHCHFFFELWVYITIFPNF